MVKEVYVCEECNFAYSEKEQAKECEDFCKQHKSCSMEITKKEFESMKKEIR